MVRSNFDKKLKELHEKMVEMGSVVETAIEDSVKAFKGHDTDLCKEIIEGDNVVDSLEKEIESKCLWLIARQQPVAADLRHITTALKVTTDMERIGDHASDVAQLTMRLPGKNAFSDMGHIAQMASAAKKMVKNAVSAYVDSDARLAEATIGNDDQVDDYFNLIKKELVTVFANQPDKLDNAIDLLLIAKYLERIADHAVNICEWVRFSQTGEHKDTQIF